MKPTKVIDTTTKEEILQPFIVGALKIPVINYKDALWAMQEYAEQFHQEKLREKLFNFQKWYEFKLFKVNALDDAIKHNVNEYLKQKQ